MTTTADDVVQLRQTLVSEEKSEVEQRHANHQDQLRAVVVQKLKLNYLMVATLDKPMKMSWPMQQKILRTMPTHHLQGGAPLEP